MKGHKKGKTGSAGKSHMQKRAAYTYKPGKSRSEAAARLMKKGY